MKIIGANAMSAQMKYSAKKGAMAVRGLGEGRKRVEGRTQSGGPAVFVGWCDGLKTFIFDYGAPNHPELYSKSKEALLDYVRVE